MATGLKLFAEIVPDTKELKAKLKGEKFKIEGTVEKGKGLGIAGNGPKDTGGGGGPGGGGGGMLGTGMGMLGAMGIFSILQKIAGFLMGLEPIQAIMTMIGAIAKLFFLPLALLLFTLLRPILITMLKIMPLWWEFWQDPVNNLVPLIKKLGAFFKTGMGIVGKTIFEKVKDLVKPEGLKMGKPGEKEYGLPTETYFNWSGLKNWWGKNINDPLKKFAGFITSMSLTALIITGRAIKNFFLVTIPNWFADRWDDIKNIGGGVKDFFTKSVPKWFSNRWNDIKDVGGGIKDFFTKTIPNWFGEKWDDVKDYDLAGKIESGLGEIGDIFADAIATLVKIVYDIVNKLGLGLIHFDYPDWVQKQLGLGKYEKKEYNKSPEGGLIDILAGRGANVPYNIPGATGPVYTPVDDFILSGGKLYRTNPNDVITGSRGGLSNTRPIIMNIMGVMSDELVRQSVFMVRREMQRGVYSG